MNIYVAFSQKKNDKISNGTIYKYSSKYTENDEMVNILSSKELSKKEIDSLGKIYFNDKKILEKGYIDLIIDKYIINFKEV